MGYRRPRHLSSDQATELLRHLRTHLNPDYARYLVREIDVLCGQVRKKDKGTKKSLTVDSPLMRTFGSLNASRERRGPQPKADHSEIIQHLSDYYPTRFARKYEHSPFAVTVNMVLRFAFGTDHRKSMATVKDKIIDALRGYEYPNHRSRAVQNECMWKP